MVFIGGGRLLLFIALNFLALIDSSTDAETPTVAASSWQDYEAYTFHRYNRSFPLFLKTNTSTFDVNNANDWWWCVRVYSDTVPEGGRKLGSVCVNAHPSLKETRLWRYSEAGKGSLEYEKVVLPDSQDGVLIWTIDFSTDPEFLFLSCDGLQVSQYTLRELATRIPSEALYLQGVYLTMGYAQQSDECAEGKEFRTDTMRCTNCSLGHHRDNSTGHICQKCPSNTYALEGWAHCSPCPEGGCKPGWTCTPTDPAVCALAYEKIDNDVEYPFDGNCKFTLNETYPGALSWSDIWFLDADKRALGQMYWDYDNGFVQFQHEVNTFHEWKFHSSARLNKEDHGLSTQVIFDMTDGNSLKMTIDGKNYIRAVTCQGDGCVNLQNVKFFRSTYLNAHKMYENWANCGVISETCEDTNERCEETVSSHYCRTEWAVLGCKKFCKLCEQDFTALSTWHRRDFNINGRKSFLRVKDWNLVTAYNTAYYYRYTCIGLVTQAQDEENEQSVDDRFGMLCWNINARKLRISYKNGLSDERSIILPPMTNNEYYVWDFEIIEGKQIAVSCQGVDIFSLSAAPLDSPVTQVELSYGEVEVQVRYIELAIETGSVVDNVYLSGEECTITCHNKIQTNLWFIRHVSWKIDGIEAEESEFLVNQTIDVVAGVSRLTVLPTMGSWNIKCKFVVSHGADGSSDQDKKLYVKDMDYVKNINLHVSGCSGDADCLIIDNCNISVSRLCDNRKDCKNGLDEEICQKTREYDSHSRVMDDLIDFEEVCTMPQTANVKQMCYNRERYSNGLYKEHLSRSHHNFLPPCLPGIKSSGQQGTTRCKTHDLQYRYGMREVWHVPEQKIRCRNSFGHPYVYAKSAGLCSDDPGEQVSFRGGSVTCNNQEDFITVSIPKQEVRFKLYRSGGSYTSNFFQCGTGNCIPYSQVCDLVDDCGDSSDEVNCANHYACDGNPNKLIPPKNKCDGAIDCEGAGDECSQECVTGENRIIPGNIVRFCVWAMGFIGILLNGFLMVEFAIQLRQVESFNGFFNKTFVGLIAFGDAIVAFYLIAIAAVDKTLSKDYCIERPQWISSTFCRALGGISTFGGELSLFSMTILSLFRAHSLNSLFDLRDLNKKNRSKVFYLAAVLGIGLAIVSFIPNFQFEDYFTYGMFYKNSTVFPGIATKTAHMQAIKFYLDPEKMEGASWSWTSLRELLKFEYSLGEGRKIGFYGYNDICYFNYFGDPNSANTTLALFPILVLLINFSCFIVNVACYIIIFRISNFKEECALQCSTLKPKDQPLHFKIACIVFFSSLIWTTFILLCLLHSQNVVDLREYAEAFCLCIIPLSSVINPVIFNGNMFFAKPDQLKRRQMGLWVTVLVGFGMALGLELQ